MKRIWFTQQKPFDYIPLRLGLGYLTAEQADAASEKIKYGIARPTLLPKMYTTRKHRLSGEYYVVEGSRFKAKPVEPRIEFTAHPVATIIFSGDHKLDWYSHNDQIPINLPELDLGILGATFDHLRDELFKLNKNVTVDTKFHINRLESIKEY
jgi:hypothetical protein